MAINDNSHPYYLTLTPAKILSNSKIFRLGILERGIYYELIYRMFTEGLRLENDDELLSENFGIEIEIWQEVKRKLMRGADPLIYVEGNYIMAPEAVEGYNKAAALIESRKAAGQAGGKAKKAKEQAASEPSDEPPPAPSQPTVETIEELGVEPKQAEGRLKGVDDPDWVFDGENDYTLLGRP